MCLDDRPHDREAEPRAPSVAGPRVVEAHETVEDAVAIDRRDARTIVIDGQHDLLARVGHTQPDAIHRMADCVLGQVAYDPLELHRFLGVEAPVEGSWYPYVKKGEVVRKGQAIGEMRDFFDAKLAVLSSDEDAAILGVMTIPPRRKGDWVMGLGTLA